MIFYAFILGLLGALIISLLPTLKNVVAGFGLRQRGLRPGDIIEHNKDIAWVKKIGLVFTSLEARAGEHVLMSNHLFASTVIRPNRYTQSQISQRLPLSMFAEDGTQRTADAISAVLNQRSRENGEAPAPVGTLDWDTEHQPVLQTKAWLAGDGTGKEPVKDALLDEILLRVRTKGIAPAQHLGGNHTVH